MVKIVDRYALAVHSGNLKVSRELDKTTDTVIDDIDILGAMGLADRDLGRGYRSDGSPVRPAPLAVPLERLFAGDNRAAHEIVKILAEMVFSQSWKLRAKINRVTAHDIACACLAWYRNGVCKPCGGHGYSLIPGVPSLSSHECQECDGTGKIRPARVFAMKHLELAQWLIDQIMRETGRAGPAAMRLLADRMDFK